MAPLDHGEESAGGPSEDQRPEMDTDPTLDADGNPPQPYSRMHPMSRSGSSPPRSDPGFSGDSSSSRRAPPEWFYDERIRCVLHNRAFKECAICLAFINHLFPAIATQNEDYERAIDIMIKAIEDRIRNRMIACMSENESLRGENNALNRKIDRILDDLEQSRALLDTANNELARLRGRDEPESRPHKKPRQASASSSSAPMSTPVSTPHTIPVSTPQPNPSVTPAPATVIVDQDVDMNPEASTTESSSSGFTPVTVQAGGLQWIISPQPGGHGHRFPPELLKPAYAWDSVWNSEKGVFERGGKMYLPLLKAGGHPIPKFVMEDDVSQNILALGGSIALGPWAYRDRSKPLPPRPFTSSSTIPSTSAATVAPVATAAASSSTPIASTSSPASAPVASAASTSTPVVHSDLVTPTDSAGIDHLVGIVRSETETNDRKSIAIGILQTLMRVANGKAVKARTPTDVYALYVWPSVKPGGKGKGKNPAIEPSPAAAMKAMINAALGRSPKQPEPYQEMSAHLAWFTYQFRVVDRFPEQTRSIPRGISSIKNDAGELEAEPSSTRSSVRFSRLNTLGNHGQGTGSVVEVARTLFFLSVARIVMFPDRYRERMNSLGLTINPIRRDIRLVVSPNIELDDVVRLLATCGVTQDEVNDSVLWGRNWVSGYLATTPDSDPVIHPEYEQAMTIPRPSPLSERSEVAPTMTLDILSEHRTAGASSITIANLRSQVDDAVMADSTSTGLDATTASASKPAGDPLGSDGSSMTPPPNEGESSSSPNPGEMAVDEEAGESTEAAKKSGTRTSRRLSKK